MPRHAVLLDACVAINLIATDDFDEIAHVLDTGFLIADQAAVEIGHLREDIAGEVVRTPIVLDRHVAAGTMRLLALTPAELPLYVELAAVVDDGEAATIAIAKTRGLSMATDDRKARRVCHEIGVPEPVRSLRLLHAYADAASLDEDAVRQRLIRLRSRASFRPPRTDPDGPRWRLHTGDEQQWTGAVQTEGRRLACPGHHEAVTSGASASRWSRNRCPSPAGQP